MINEDSTKKDSDGNDTPALSDFAANCFDRIKRGNTRLVFGWKDAIEELVKAGLIEKEDFNGIRFTVKIKQS